MTPELAGWRELAQFMTNHILGDKDRHMHLAVMHGDRFADKIRRNR